MGRPRIRSEEYIKQYRSKWGREFSQIPLGKYKAQRQQAKERGVEWKFTFEDWCELWQDSGHWAERGPTGFVMCRYGDIGPYSIDNVYIAHHLQNKKDQQLNGKGTTPPRNDKLTPEQRFEIYNTPREIKHKELSQKFGVHEAHISRIRRGHFIEDTGYSR